MNHAHAHPRAAVLLLAATCLLLHPGCFKKKTYTPPPAPGTVDLSNVTPVSPAQAALVATRICRLFDIRYRGSDQPRVLTLNRKIVVDDNGIEIRIIATKRLEGESDG